MSVIRELRIKKGMTQKELGLKFKTPKAPEIICRWEKGTSTPSSLHMMELSTIFEVSVEKILSSYMID